MPPPPPPPPMPPMPPMPPTPPKPPKPHAPRAASLPYLQGYPPDVLSRVRAMLAAGELADWVVRRHPEAHTVRTERALYDYVADLKARHLRSAPALAKVAYDPGLTVTMNALGTHTAVSRVQGGRLKAKREIRIAALFKDAPANFLRTIVVHELAHLKERDHDKAFYALCQHMAPDYHQWEFELRLWLTAREAAAVTGATGTTAATAAGGRPPPTSPDAVA